MLAIADFVPGDVDKEQMIADCVNDQIDVVGRGVLGLTLACARCHDHKFDPISTRDYYALAGIFFSTRVIPGPIAGNTPLVRVPLLSPVELKAIDAEAERDKQRIVELSQLIRSTSDTARAPISANGSANTRRRISRPPAKRCRRPQPSGRTLPSWPPPPSSTKRSSRGGSSISKRARIRRCRSRSPAAIAPSANRLVHELATKLATIARDRQAVAAQASTSRAWPTTNCWSARRSAHGHRQRRADHCLARSRRPVARRLPGRKHPGPTRMRSEDGQAAHTVARFDGSQVLQAPCGVPPTGSLFVVFKPVTGAGGDQRLIGWEDSSVGQHGLGLMLDAAGGLCAARRAAARVAMSPARCPRPRAFSLSALPGAPAA